MTQTLDHVVVVHKLIGDKRKSQIDEYSDQSNIHSLGRDSYSPHSTTIELSLDSTGS